MLRSLKEQGMEPEALKTQPTLHEHLVFDWDTFWSLNRERAVTEVGPRKLKLVDFLQHAALYQFTRLDTQQIWKNVTVLDDAYISFAEKRQAERAAQAKAKAKRPVAGGHRP